MTPLDQYLQSQIGPLLQPGEQVLQTAHMRRQPGLLMQLLLVGGLLLMLMTKTYLAVLTNRRLILMRTKASFWTGTPKPMNLGIEEHDIRSFQKVTTSGLANNRSMTFHTTNGTMKLRISPWFKAVSGTAAFLEQVPNLINSGQIAALGAGMPHQGYGAAAALPAPQPAAPPQHYAAPPEQYAPPANQHYAAPPQQYAPPANQHYAAPPQQYAPPPSALAPGLRVMVLAQDGHRYPGVVVQLQGGHCLCAMQNGQFWYPEQSVSPG